jgi:hypothetical protein
MPLRFFADHCVPNSVIQILRAAGHEVLILKEHIPRDSEDPIVLAKAQELEAVLISLNGDFADIVSYPPSLSKGVIALQMKDHPEILPKLMQRLMDYLSTHFAMSDYEGRLFVVESHRIRMRK